VKQLRRLGLCPFVMGMRLTPESLPLPLAIFSTLAYKMPPTEGTPLRIFFAAVRLKTSDHPARWWKKFDDMYRMDGQQQK